MKFTIDDLREIRNGSVSMLGTPSDLMAWLNGVGVDPEVWDEFTHDIVSAMAYIFERDKEIHMAQVIAAVYSAGFEMGIRTQQTRQAMLA